MHLNTSNNLAVKYVLNMGKLAFKTGKTYTVNVQLYKTAHSGKKYTV